MLSRTRSHGFRDETQSSALTSPQRKVLPSGSVEPAAALCRGSHVAAKLWSSLRDLSTRLRLTIPRRTSFGNLVHRGYACRTICLDTRNIRNGGRSFPKIARKGHDRLKGLWNLVRQLLLLGFLAVVFGATAIAGGIDIGAPLISGDVSKPTMQRGAQTPTFDIKCTVRPSCAHPIYRN
jgi:hypothetical protein